MTGIIDVSESILCITLCPQSVNFSVGIHYYNLSLLSRFAQILAPYITHNHYRTLKTFEQGTNPISPLQ